MAGSQASPEAPPVPSCGPSEAAPSTPQVRECNLRGGKRNFGGNIPPKESLLFPPSRTISFRVASLTSCFPLTDKKRGEGGEGGREASTDVNYWVMLSGSPTEPVAMATHSGSGPLREGVQRITGKYHENSSVSLGLGFLYFWKHFFVQMHFFLPLPLALALCCPVVMQHAQSSQTFPIFLSILTPFHHSDCLSKPVFPK